jgi:hypothetical protein
MAAVKTAIAPITAMLQGMGMQGNLDFFKEKTKGKNQNFSFKAARPIFP